MRISYSLVLVVLAGASVGTRAQTPLSYPGCDAPPEVRAALDVTLSPDALAKLKVGDRVALQQQVLSGLLAKYPREYVLYELQMSLAQAQQWYADASAADDAKAKFDALRDRWVKNAREHPDDALALLLASKILAGKDTPEAIRLMEAAKAKAPDFPWPAHELSIVYWREKYADAAKMKENLERFYSLCPAWTYPISYPNDFENQVEGARLQTDLPLVAKTAAALRQALEKESDPKRLLAYQILWQREFLTRPPTEHDAEREQIKKDLKRLESLVPNGDAHWRSFLIEGYKLSGASNEELARMQDALAHDFPHSIQADYESWDQWRKDHPRPDGQKDAEAWKAYYAADIEMIKKMIIREFPDDLFAQRSDLFMAAQEDEYISKEDGLAALDRYLQAKEDYGGAGMMNYGDYDPARFLLDHGWEPQRALELLEKTSTYRDGGHTKTDWGDSLSESTLKRFQKGTDREDRATLGLILKAAALTGKPEEALKFRAAVEEAPPDDKGALEQYWTNRARFAALDKRPLDAFAYYRLALDSRTHAPEYHHGILRDDLMVEFHDLWTAQGGTEAAWTVWNPPVAAEKPAAGAENAAAGKNQNTITKDKPASPNAKASAEKKNAPESDWELVTKKMPAFELSDFAGKIWRQKDMQGKVVVVVSWATWCAPCGLEDKLLEKFYDKVKDRGDLAVLSFNVDENPGQVLPFMRKQGYTFPVLAAFSYEDAKDMVPRTWIIDTQGNWRCVKNGYDESKTYAEFEKELLDQVDKAKAGE